MVYGSKADIQSEYTKDKNKRDEEEMKEAEELYWLGKSVGISEKDLLDV